MSYSSSIQATNAKAHTSANISTAPLFRVKDPMSALTHFIGAIFAVIMTPVILVYQAGMGAEIYKLAALSVFMISMIMLYSASATYHAFNISEKANLRLKRLDHMMIFVLIAGSYTPVCLVTLQGQGGGFLLSLIWGMAILGMGFKLCWVTCPKWISSVIYIGMGWACVIALPTLIHTLSFAAFMWLLAGGLIYTIGGVIYALKLSAFNSRDSLWGSHEIFHLFVMGGSLCHFIFMFFYL